MSEKLYNKPQPKVCLLTFGEYFRLNHDLSIARGWQLGQDTERVTEMSPQLAKVNITFDTEGNETGYELACVCPISREIQENHSDLLTGITLHNPADVILVDIEFNSIDAGELDADWLIQHYERVGNKRINGLKVDAERTSVSDNEVESLKGNDIAIITKQADASGKFVVVKKGIDILLSTYIENAKIESSNTIEEYNDLDIPTTNFPNLPESGWVDKGIYNYGNKAVYCIQPHSRTIYTPDQTPALFSTFRTNTDELDWIENEKVEAGWKRNFEGKQYECIQAHMTLKGWEPDQTPALWNEVIVIDPEVKPPQWVIGNWTTYTVGYQVYDSGKVWEAINTTHTWIQPDLTGNGAISWKYIKDWIE